jgi:hypothetical protein
MNDEVEKMWKERGLFELQSRNFLGGAKGQKKNQSK